MAGAWGCPHEENDKCSKVNHLPCNPGMKGCVLAGRYFFFNDNEKNERLRNKQAREAEASSSGCAADVVDAADDDTKA